MWVRSTELHRAYLQCKFIIMFYVQATQQHLPTPSAVYSPQLCVDLFLPHYTHTLPHTCGHASVHTSLLALPSFQTRVYSRSRPHPCLSGTYLPSSQKSFDSPNGFAFQACACVSRRSFPPVCWAFLLVKTQEPSWPGK